jgi:heme exporter protein D
MMEEHMFGESTQILLFLAIVGLTVVSTIDLVMQPVKQRKNIDREH